MLRVRQTCHICYIWGTRSRFGGIASCPSVKPRLKETAYWPICDAESYGSGFHNSPCTPNITWTVTLSIYAYHGWTSRSNVDVFRIFRQLILTFDDGIIVWLLWFCPSLLNPALRADDCLYWNYPVRDCHRRPHRLPLGQLTERHSCRQPILFSPGQTPIVTSK